MIYDTLIVGGGISGLTASVYCSRAGLTSLIFEQKVWGGQIVSTDVVTNYPGFEKISGFDLSSNLTLQAKNLGVIMKNEKVISADLLSKIKSIKTNKAEYYGKTVIIAAGSSPKHAGFKGEEEFTGRGVSYCATCDGAFYKGKDVVVIGGGFSAVQESLYLSSIASKVYVIVRKSKFRCSDSEVMRLKQKDNVEILLNTKVISVNGKEGIESVTLESADKIYSISSDKPPVGVFVFVGSKPNSELFCNVLNTDERGYVFAGEDCRTNINGVFVCGDIRTKSLRQLVTAASDGASAAVCAERYISEYY